jgi:hypothetical protein
MPQPQAEGHIFEHGHVRIERVVLKHHGDVAILRRQIVDQLAADEDFAAAHLLESGNHAQCGALAAA